MKKSDKYLCNSREWNCYIKGNIYVVEDVKSNSIGFINENKQLHYVSYEDLLTDFSNLQQANDIKVNYEIVPNHYDNKQGYDVIDISKHYGLNFNRGNLFKYICRAGKKDNELQDLKKALDYLQREIKFIENE